MNTKLFLLISLVAISNGIQGLDTGAPMDDAEGWVKVEKHEGEEATESANPAASAAAAATATSSSSSTSSSAGAISSVSTASSAAAAAATLVAANTSSSLEMQRKTGAPAASARTVAGKQAAKPLFTLVDTHAVFFSDRETHPTFDLQSLLTNEAELKKTCESSEADKMFRELVTSSYKRPPYPQRVYLNIVGQNKELLGRVTMTNLSSSFTPVKPRKKKSVTTPSSTEASAAAAASSNSPSKKYFSYTGTLTII